MSPPFLQRVGAAASPGAVLGGLPSGAAAWVVAEIARVGALGMPLLVVAPEPEEAGRLLREIAFHLGRSLPVLPWPADDVRPFDGLSPHPAVPRARLVALDLIDRGAPAVIVAPARALLQRVLPPEALAGLRMVLRPGLVIERQALVSALVDRGYLVAPRAEEPGTLAFRGGVVDLWASGEPGPVRIEYFDDEIDTIHGLDPVHFRGTGPRKEVAVLPAREAVVQGLARASERTARAVDQMGGGQATRRRVLEDLKEGLWFPGAEDYLAALHPVVDPLSREVPLVVVDRRGVIEALGRAAQEATQRWRALPVEERPVVLPEDRYADSLVTIEALRARGLALEELAVDAADMGARGNGALRVQKGELAPTIALLREWLEEGYQVALVVDGEAHAERLKALLQPHGLLPKERKAGKLPAPGGLALWKGDLPRGFHAPDSRIAIVTADEIFGDRAPAAKPTGLKEAALGHVTELKVGDLIVHIRHGVGRFLGLKRVEVRGPSDDRGRFETLQQDFAELEYRGGDRMLVPVTRLDQLYRYRAIGDRPPPLDKLGGQTWESRKARVRDRVLAMAQELLRIHAMRAVVAGHSYEGRPELFLQLEERFPFHETPDQLAAIEDVLADLAGTEPMDRLVVGDVGFGKTEVAIRAAVRVALEGRQVAVLCPTTVLAAQHAESFAERIGDLPLRVELLSRFKSPAEQKVILAHTASGGVDILIGTSALLGRGLQFKNLGLVVIDEEHRFGVSQKEKLKERAQRWSREPVEYLAMSATPIPRTLHLALSGLRKVSVIATPPGGRLPVQTHLRRWSEEAIRADIMAELTRGGQVFFVHNRVTGIATLAAHIAKLVPEARVAVAHGQMGDEELEQVLVDFVRHRTHVLVCTTIIESGIDMPNVNTILVNAADDFGLSQLYQLRGRVGRSHRRGHCVLLVEDEERLRSKAARRLRVLQENTELGAGFAVAQADMELRGAGDLLGDKQHGHIQAVGLDIYVELLEDAVAEARGDLHRQRLDPEIEVPLPQILPESYVPVVTERLTEYRRLAASHTVQDVRRLVGEWEDNYGAPPPEVLNLGWAAECKVRCRAAGIARVSWLGVRVVLEIHESSTVPLSRIVELVTKESARFELQSEKGRAGRLSARFSPAEGEYPFRFLDWVLRRLEGI